MATWRLGTVGAFYPLWGIPQHWPAQNLLLPSGQALLFDEEKISSREDLNVALTDLVDSLSTHSDEVNIPCFVPGETLNVSQNDQGR